MQNPFTQGHGVFSAVTGGRPAVISGVTDGGTPGHPDPKDRVEQGGGRPARHREPLRPALLPSRERRTGEAGGHPPSVTPRNGQVPIP